MKKKRFRFRFNLRLYFTLIVMAEIGISVVVAVILGVFLNLVAKGNILLPLTVWQILLSLLIGASISALLGKWFFGPITQLSNAMKKVADGDFSVRLTADKGIREIEDIYANFNLMAKDLGATEILQTDFVSNVSHEFKTPINAIEGYATLLQGDENLSPEMEQYVEKILFNTKRLSGLVGNILLLSKVDNQVIQSRVSTFRLDEQIRQSVVLLEPKWEEKEIEFDVDLERVEYTGDENMLMHVWNNIIGNAIKFDPPGGYVGIKMKQRDGEITVTVEDSGPGVDEEAKKHIFDRFYQADSSHKEEGNGLGLALVKRIVDANKGRVTVENRIGSGCRFTVVLPRTYK